MVMKGTTQRQVIYNSDTKWMYGTQANNKSSSLDDLKENWYVNWPYVTYAQEIVTRKLVFYPEIESAIIWSILESVPCWISMQKWEYKVFASHLDPAELVVLLDESGREGWELVTLVAVIDQLPLEVIDPAAAVQALKADEVAEVVPMQAFRYIFKRSLTAL
jgi:hypothetical protein